MYASLYLYVVFASDYPAQQWMRSGNETRAQWLRGN